MTSETLATTNHCAALPMDTVLLAGRPLGATEAHTVREIAECGGAMDVQICDLALAPTLLPSDVLTIGLFDLETAAADDLVLYADGNQCKVRRVEDVLFCEGRRFGIRVAESKTRRTPTTLRSSPGRGHGPAGPARRYAGPVALRLAVVAVVPGGSVAARPGASVSPAGPLQSRADRHRPPLLLQDPRRRRPPRISPPGPSPWAGLRAVPGCCRASRNVAGETGGHAEGGRSDLRTPGQRSQHQRSTASPATNRVPNTSLLFWASQQGR